jgi:plastocyanin
MAGRAGPSWEEFRSLEERLERSATRGDTWMVFAVVFAGIAVFLSIVGIGLSFRNVDDARRISRSAAPTPAQTGSAPGAASTPTCPTSARLPAGANDHGAVPAQGTTLTLEAADFFFKPTCVVSVTPGSTITLTVHNGGQALHNVTFPDQGIDTDVAPGQTVTVNVKVGAAGTYTYFCKYHRTSGMVGALVAGGG